MLTSIPLRREADFTPSGPFGRDRGLAARQLDLCLWAKGSVQEVLASYFRSLQGLSENTVSDYRTREGWLMRVLGPASKVENIGIEALERIARMHGPDGDGSLMYVTIGKRFDYFKAACTYAAARKAIRKDDVPEVPKLPDDGRRLQRALTVAEYKELRLALVDRFRCFLDVGFGSGLHSCDIFQLTRGMVDPSYVWRDEDGSELWRGRVWRVNSKTPDCVPAWIPMEIELREIASKWKPASPDELVTGHLWALKKNFDAACDKIGIERCTPNRDVRRSYASMMAARGYGLEAIRHFLGHLGPPTFDDAGKYQRAGKSSVATQHYLRGTDDLIRAELRRRQKSI
jgi:hypothetical protein